MYTLVDCIIVFNCCIPALCTCVSRSQRIYCLPLPTHPRHVLHPSLLLSLPDRHLLHPSPSPRKPAQGYISSREEMCDYIYKHFFSVQEHEHSGARPASWSGAQSQSPGYGPAPQRLSSAPILREDLISEQNPAVISLRRLSLLVLNI